MQCGRIVTGTEAVGSKSKIHEMEGENKGAAGSADPALTRNKTSDLSLYKLF